MYPEWFALGAFHLTAWVTLSRAARTEWSVCFYKACTTCNSNVWFTDSDCVGKMEQLRLGEDDQMHIPMWERVKGTKYTREMQLAETWQTGAK